MTEPAELANSTLGTVAVPGSLPDAAQVRRLMHDLRRMMLSYRFGIDEISTKVSILREEFRLIADYNPIEHVGSRLKSFESIIAKARRKNIPLTLAGIRGEMFDVAGIRVTCSFVSDIYRVRDMLVAQQDITLVEERDYIAHPKPTGYKSLHLIVRVPVYLSDRVEDVIVEIQLRTIAMDFWASLEHKIFYKLGRTVPRHLSDSLKLAADVAWSLDTSMERIHEEVRTIAGDDDPLGEPEALGPEEMLAAFMRTIDVSGSEQGRGSGL